MSVPSSATSTHSASVSPAAYCVGRWNVDREGREVTLLEFGDEEQPVFEVVVAHLVAESLQGAASLRVDGFVELEFSRREHLLRVRLDARHDGVFGEVAGGFHEA